MRTVIKTTLKGNESMTVKESVDEVFISLMDKGGFSRFNRISSGGGHFPDDSEEVGSKNGSHKGLGNGRAVGKNKKRKGGDLLVGKIKGQANGQAQVKKGEIEVIGGTYSEPNLHAGHGRIQ
ncbi:MAG: hypothetical protein AAF634_16425 [Bacteroidota bacterium]